jgi:deferrochelatase/peroxidase EfeB
MRFTPNPHAIDKPDPMLSIITATTAFGFIPINNRLAKFDMMNQFTTHVGSAIFAVPPGAKPGSYIGAGLFET